jgi:hypothetical protein
MLAARSEKQVLADSPNGPDAMETTMLNNSPTTPKVGVSAGNRGKGRKKGVPNKTTALLKDAILKAAETAGGHEGLVGYLEKQARENPGPFLALLGKVLPLQFAGAGEPIKIIYSNADAGLL